MGAAQKINFVTHEQFRVNDFIAINDCPRQRDTEGRAKKAVKNHLKEPSLTHLQVNITRLPNGETYKLDGHTRSYLWKNNLLKPLLNVVDATVFHVRNIDEVKRLYEQFDSQNAVETSIDQISGSTREYGWEPKSGYFKGKKFTNALILADMFLFNKGKERGFRSGVDRTNEKRRLFEQFLETMQEIDQMRIDYGARRLSSGLAAAMIVSFYASKRKRLINADKVRAFWQSFIESSGTKVGRDRDAVQALTEYVDGLTGSRGRHDTDICVKALSAVLGYHENKIYQKSIREMDVQRFQIS